MLSADLMSKLTTSPDTLMDGPTSGSGCFGSVSRIPDLPGLVCKRVERFDLDAWYIWAMYAMRYKGKVADSAYLPTIHALRLDLTTQTLWAVMEELDEATWLERRAIYTIRGHGPTYKEDAYRKSKPFLRVLDTFFKLAGVNPANIRLDLHGFNSMMRVKGLRRQRVITDPMVLVDEDDRWLSERDEPEEEVTSILQRVFKALYDPADQRITVVGDIPTLA